MILPAGMMSYDKRRLAEPIKGNNCAYCVEEYERETKDSYRQETQEEKAEREQFYEASQIRLEEPLIIKKLKDKKKSNGK